MPRFLCFHKRCCRCVDVESDLTTVSCFDIIEVIERKQRMKRKAGGTMKKTMDISPEVRRFLEKLKGRPGMYIGSKKISDLETFIWGMDIQNALVGRPLFAGILPKEFEQFVMEHYENSSMNMGSFYNVLQNEEDEEKALLKWFELLDEYLISCGFAPIENWVGKYASMLLKIQDAKAVVFDIGQTLVHYPISVNWSEHYRAAFEAVAGKLHFTISEEEYLHIKEVLEKYNARINPRQIEVPADTIFAEIIEGTSIPEEHLPKLKKGFYSYFQKEAIPYPDAEETLIELKKQGIKIATLSDVAYGMENKYALKDLGPLLSYIDIPYTSNDIGLRKPSAKGVERIAKEFGVAPEEIVFVGDEWKDMDCALRAGAIGVAINRRSNEPGRLQINSGTTISDFSIEELKDLLELIGGKQGE